VRHASLSHGLDASQAVVVVVVAVEVLSESNGEDGEEAQNEVHVDRSREEVIRSWIGTDNYL
jgi:hypothetical protein